MGNCCRIFTHKSVEDCQKIVGNHPAVLRWGDNAIKPNENNLLSHKTVINSINEIKSIVNLLGQECIVQDLDGYGINKYFKCVPE